MSFSQYITEDDAEMYETHPHLEPIYACYVNRLKTFVPVGTTVLFNIADTFPAGTLRLL